MRPSVGLEVRAFGVDFLTARIVADVLPLGSLVLFLIADSERLGRRGGCVLIHVCGEIGYRMHRGRMAEREVHDMS